MTNPYEYCINNGYDYDSSTLASCLADQVRRSEQENVAVNIASPVPFMVFVATMVFFMQAGFAMICAGAVRRKNVQNTTLKNLLDVCGGAIAFYTVGYSFSFGDHSDGPVTFIGTGNFFLLDMADDDTGVAYSYWLFQFAFAATSATIVAGTLAERCQMNAYLFYSMALTGFVYPVVAHAIWSSRGFLNKDIDNPLFGSGMIDFAGSGVVHVTGGFTALIATKLLGARKGRFYDERGELLEEPKSFPGHSKSLQMLGTFILWFGWFGFNGGSALDSDGNYNPAVVATAVVNSTLSGAMSAIVALFTNLIITERLTGEPHYNLSFAMNGCLAGLAAITGSCGVVEPWSAIVIGAIAGWLFLGCSHLLLRLHLDDAVDAIPVHLAGGAWGVIATGLFASPTGLRRYFGVENPEHIGLFYSFGRGAPDGALFGCQIIGLIFIIGWVSLIMFPFFVLLNYFGLLRADSLEEIVGLDVSYHGWTPAEADDVTQRDIDAYTRQTKLRNRFSRHSSSRHEDDDEADNEGVDRFE
mmetsp:Transcript_22250/g.33310  ORF Transcript_22250/g.33310 Transcript_22250/m.33310 type:complete len:527 (-) Transcript_22250:1190-2770(-)|eukprot:CAMPEP_0203676316 /NCGR_PEP_ID=MMETSP0090-20130426/24259_1 /ASSEMBLY_ACC=CAM_ASM_001088 /TAXON_ID=426623 /ORGANISM="Chaetoceros affinis, Strain CCMP159" /LENGTH=526 /DNA_ID=CAMNT_0050542835 /DNA_START=90 /DNA_END=1670 /DNA_ORIENTATION=-